jgi:two-component system, LytTR family, response regulator
MRALIVDHEPQGRAVLRELCEADGSIDEVTVAECGATAIEMIRANQPDLLFLDVELKDMTGFDVMRSLKGSGRPAVIMVAPHENHAFEAYRSGAIDYLTKPLGAGNVATAIEKAHQRHDLWLTSTPGQDSATSNHGVRRTQQPMLLMAESSHRLYFLEVEDIDYVESCGNYVLIHIGDQKFLRRDTIKRLAASLRDVRFKWIRRSTLINLSRVAFAEKLDGGALAFTLKSGARLVSKRRIRL